MTLWRPALARPLKSGTILRYLRERGLIRAVELIKLCSMKHRITFALLGSPIFWFIAGGGMNVSFGLLTLVRVRALDIFCGCQTPDRRAVSDFLNAKHL
jgi:hypothetical protein